MNRNIKKVRKPAPLKYRVTDHDLSCAPWSLLKDGKPGACICKKKYAGERKNLRFQFKLAVGQK